MSTARRRGRRGGSNFHTKLERSRQSARECRTRKKLRYQYLEELVDSRERAIFTLRSELEQFKQWCIALDKGSTPPELAEYLRKERFQKHGLIDKSNANVGMVVPDQVVHETKAPVPTNSQTLDDDVMGFYESPAGREDDLLDLENVLREEELSAKNASSVSCTQKPVQRTVYQLQIFRHSTPGQPRNSFHTAPPTDSTVPDFSRLLST